MLSVLILVIFCFSCKQSKLHVSSISRLELTPQNINELRYPLTSTPLVSAHRGGKYIKGYPENCLETFKHITKRQSLIIECDIAQTKDNKLILMHDNALDRTTTGSGKVINVSSEYIKSLKLKDFKDSITSFKVPFLEEVLKWAKGKAILSLDLKKSVNNALLIDILNEFNAHEYCEIITYGKESAVYYSVHAPEYTLSVNIRNERELQSYLDSDLNIDRLKPFVGTRRKSSEFYKKLHENGLIVTLGTLGNIDKQAQARGFKIYDQLVKEGVDIFATDYPLEVIEHFHHNE